MIDIVIPTYKVLQTKGLLESLQTQLGYLQNTAVVNKVVVVSDWPTDNFLLEEFVKGFSKVQLIQSEKNAGQGYARNLGFSSTESTYVIFLDQDDAIKFGNIQWKADLIFTSTEIQFPNTTKKYFSKILPYLINRVNTIDQLYLLMIANIRVSPGSLAIKRDLFKSIAGFPDLKNRGSDDFGLLVRSMMKKATVAYCQETMFTYSVHDNQSRNVLDLDKSIQEFLGLEGENLSNQLKRVIRFRLSLIGSFIGKVFARIIAI